MRRLLVFLSLGVLCLAAWALIVHTVIGEQSSAQATNQAIATDQWDWTLKEDSYDEFTTQVDLKLYGPSYTGEANLYMLEVRSEQVVRDSGSWAGAMAANKPGSVTVAAPDQTTYFGKWELHYEEVGKSYTSEEEAKGGTLYQYISPEEKKKQEEDKQKKMMLA